MYKQILSTGAASLLFFSVAAHGQSNSGGTKPDANRASNNTSASSSDQSKSQASSSARAMSQDKLRQVLSQAGFENVRVIDAAYLIQAKTKEGESVTMILNPPTMGGSDSSARNTSGASQSSNAQGGSGSNATGSKQ